jgi:hypothetical protein
MAMIATAANARTIAFLDFCCLLFVSNVIS